MKTKLALLAALILVAALFAWAFTRLPIQQAGLAIDWKIFWQATQGLRLDYAGGLVFSPPWTLAVLWPLTIFPLSVSWGLAAFAALAILVLSVPADLGRGRWMLAALLLCSSYPALRQVVDGNLEALVIAGVLLMLWALPRQQPPALALGLALVSSKIQESWLFLILMTVWLLKTWPRPKTLSIALWTLAFILPLLLWKGTAWVAALQRFPFRGTAIDSSLLATLTRLHAPDAINWLVWLVGLLVTLWVVRKQSWHSARAEAGLLLTAGLLLGPYAASNSALTPLAIGVIPLLQKRLGVALGLIALYTLPYLGLGRPDLRVAWESSYWTLVLLLTWLVLTMDLVKQPSEGALG